MTESDRAQGASRSRTCTEMTNNSPYKRGQEPLFVPDFKACQCDFNVISILFLERPESIRRISSVSFFYVVYHLLTVHSFREANSFKLPSKLLSKLLSKGANHEL